MVKKLKKILLSGFSLQQINMFKKNYKKVNFINYNNLQNIKSDFDAFISINRKNFEKFYNSDKDKKNNVKRGNDLVVKLVDTKDLKSLPVWKCQFEFGRGHKQLVLRIL